MLFKRKNKLPLSRRLLAWIWPARGPKRAVTYWWHRVARLPDTSHGIAAGVAAGAAMSFTPFLGLHIVLGLLIAYMVRGNYIAAVIGTAVGNPWSFPVIFALNYKIGAYFLGTEIPDNLSDLPVVVLDVLSNLSYQMWGTVMGVPTDAQNSTLYTQNSDVLMQSYETLLLPLLIGSVPTTVICWIVCYFSIKTVHEKYQRKRYDRRKVKSAAKKNAMNEGRRRDD